MLWFEDALARLLAIAAPTAMMVRLESDGLRANDEVGVLALGNPGS